MGAGFDSGKSHSRGLLTFEGSPRYRRAARFQIEASEAVQGAEQMRESGQGAHLAHAVRGSGASIGQERDRMRRVLSEIRETAAGGQKLVAEALVMIAAADSLATASYYRLQPTIDVSTPAPLTPGRPFVKARPDIHVAAPPNGHIARL
jgi:hypothetical protein